MSSPGIAQDDVWAALARSTFDTPNLTLRIPCVSLSDEFLDPIDGYAPAYALNLQLLGDTLRLVEPIKEFAEKPAICLDSLILSNGGTLATYSTSTVELDVDAAFNRDIFYTLELQANVPASGSVVFGVVSAEDRKYQKPGYSFGRQISSAGSGFYDPDFVYDQSLLIDARSLMLENLFVFEPSRLEVTCVYSDPNELLEVIDGVDATARYRLKPSVSDADNDKLFTVECSVFNKSTNRDELTVEIIEWHIFI